MTEEVQITIGCPYCNAIYTIKSPAYEGMITCPAGSCSGQWHEGKFTFSTYQVLSRDKRGLGRDQPVIWNIRTKALKDQKEKLLTLRTHNRDLQLKKGDIITLSNKKKSQGIFKKNWTGEWHQEPSVLVNNTLNAGWRL